MNRESEFAFTPPRIDFVEVPDLARIADCVQPMDRDIVSLPTSSHELWRGLASALPTPTIPLASMLTPITPALAPPALDWSSLTTMVDESFKAATQSVRPMSGQPGGGFRAKLRLLLARTRNK